MPENLYLHMLSYGRFYQAFAPSMWNIRCIKIAAIAKLFFFVVLGPRRCVLSLRRFFQFNLWHAPWLGFDVSEVLCGRTEWI
jgi:hypothetical protein